MGLYLNRYGMVVVIVVCSILPAYKDNQDSVVWDFLFSTSAYECMYKSTWCLDEGVTVGEVGDILTTSLPLFTTYMYNASPHWHQMSVDHLSHFHTGSWIDSSKNVLISCDTLWPRRCLLKKKSESDGWLLFFSHKWNFSARFWQCLCSDINRNCWKLLWENTAGCTCI